jgi:hypothetical protein
MKSDTVQHYHIYPQTEIVSRPGLSANNESLSLSYHIRSRVHDGHIVAQVLCELTRFNQSNQVIRVIQEAVGPFALFLQKLT